MIFHRFTRIHREFGTKVFAKTVFLLVALVGMSLLGAIGLKSPWAAAVAAIGLFLGWFLRRSIVEWAESLFWAVPAGLFVYGMVLLVGERVMGISRDLQLLIITATTVFLFDLQFWSLSDPSYINIEREAND